MTDPTPFEKKLSEAAADIAGTNESLSDGVARILVGRQVVAARAEVWDGEGAWSIEVAFDDGSTISVPGHTFASGPLADLVAMAGGAPAHNPGEGDYDWRYSDWRES